MFALIGQYTRIYHIISELSVAHSGQLPFLGLCGRTQLDDAAAQLAVYRAEREAARARLAVAEDKIGRARVPAHVGSWDVFFPRP